MNVRAEAIEIATVDLSRNIKSYMERSVNVRELGAAEALSTIAECIRSIEAPGKSPLCGIGIALPGIVGRDNAIARNVLALDWHDVPVVSVLKQHIGSQVPITIDHDATLGALAEYSCGAGRGAGRLLYLTSEPNGLGAAMISRGRSNGSTGDHMLQAGHLSVNPSGSRCACGSRGCLELFVSGRAIENAIGGVGSGTPGEVSAKLSTFTLKERTHFLRSDCINALKIGLVSLINTLAPDRVVLAGALAPIAAHFPSILTEALAMSVVARTEPVTIVPAALNNAMLIGAAEQALRGLKNDPILVLEKSRRTGDKT
ncbi:ROK family protein [Microvirga brassicacearum]|uniref:ROK family protein n=1 Tax=Microvirga brassicacearum TaxID=2580413 RepID=UPI0019115E9D|nr:ROK family protein [Microvirga brassicacearum]